MAMQMMKRMSASAFDRMREEDRMEPDQKYVVTDKRGRVSYGYSPDGVGVLWYDSAEKMREDVG